MAVPITAPTFDQELDPSDRNIYVFEVSHGDGEDDILQSDEAITSYSLALGADAVAAGLEILTTPPFDSAISGYTIKFWVDVTPPYRASALYSGVGTLLPVEITLNTDKLRVLQRSVLIRTQQL